MNYHQKNYSTQGGRNNKLFIWKQLSWLCHNFGLFVVKEQYLSNYKLMVGGSRSLSMMYYSVVRIKLWMWLITCVYMEQWRMHINIMVLLLMLKNMINIKSVIKVIVKFAINRIFKYIISVKINTMVGFA